MKKWESKFQFSSNDTDTMGTNKDVVIITTIIEATRVRVAARMDIIDKMTIIVPNTALTCTNKNSMVAAIDTTYGSVKLVAIGLEIARC